MKKKFIISFLAMTVFAGVVLFFFSQAAATPPYQPLKTWQCDNGEMGMLVKDPNTGEEWGYRCDAADVIGPGQCDNWIQLSKIHVAYWCSDTSKADCRLHVFSEDGAICTPLSLAGRWIQH